MSLDVEKLKAAGLLGGAAQALAHLDESRASWRVALAQSDSISKQLDKLSGQDSAFSKMLKDVKALQSPAMSIAEQYKDILGENSLAMQTIKQWQEAQRVQDESIRKMIEPLVDIRKSLLLDTATQKIIKDLAGVGAISDRFKEVVDQATRMDATTALWAKQIEDSQSQTQKLLEGMTLGSSVQSYLKDFEKINKQWQVPSEVLSMMDSFKGIQDQLGLSKLALPTIDWGSAGALAQLLGKEGLESQLAYLGIDPDGTFHDPSEQPERGILSRKQADAVALLSLLLSLLFFIYQEASSQQDKANTEAFQTETTKTIQVQSQQIQSLTVLIERALVQAAKAQEERFVVRERAATVRSKPEHGASVQGKLLPNEVVRAIDKDGKWIEVEYYHWLHEEYRTGWVLKKYLERVPASHTKGQ